MKRLINVLAICLLFAECSSKDYSAIRNSPAAKGLIGEIESSSDVRKAIISDAGGLCVAMFIMDKQKAEITAGYYLRKAKRIGVEVEFCKIVSALDATYNDTYMEGTKLAFVNAE